MGLWVETRFGAGALILRLLDERATEIHTNNKRLCVHTWTARASWTTYYVIMTIWLSVTTGSIIYLFKSFPLTAHPDLDNFAC